MYSLYQQYRPCFSYTTKYIKMFRIYLESRRPKIDRYRTWRLPSLILNIAKHVDQIDQMNDYSGDSFIKLRSLSLGDSARSKRLVLESVGETGGDVTVISLRKSNVATASRSLSP